MKSGSKTLSKYTLLNGEIVDVSVLPKEDIDFLLDLIKRTQEGEGYFLLAQRLCIPGAYPLKGNQRVTKEIHNSLLFRVAEDIIDRVGIRQGIFAPEDE